MAKITQYSRISHHTIAGSASAGLTFSVPAQEDFTDGTWTPYDLALSEIGVNEQDERVFIRIDDEIKEFAFIGASGVGFTGGPGNCITDLYLTNMYGCSPITIHDDFIQKDGTSVNSEDGKLQITFDDTGEGMMIISKTGGAFTDLDRLTVGNAGIQMQTSNLTDGTSATVLVESINGPGNDLGIVLTNINSINNNSSQISIASSTVVELLTNKNNGTTHQILLDSNPILTPNIDKIIIKTRADSGELASIDLSYDSLSNETSIELKTEDSTSTEASSITMTKDNIQTRLGNIGVLDVTQINLSLTSSYWEQSDGTFYRNAIDFNTTDMLFKAEDISNIKYGELQLTHNVTYFSHYNNGLLSYIQAQDDTIDIQTQDGNVLNQISMNSNPLVPFILRSSQGGTTSQITIASDYVTIDGGGELQIEINKSNTTIDFCRGNNKYKHDLSLIGTTGLTPTIISRIDFSGVFDKVITINANVTAVGSIANLGYGAKLFAVFKNIGGTITQLSTTDKSEKTDFTTATSDIIISGTDIVIQVTGEAATNINWKSNFSYHIS
jgi:hypothetical protein